ncbi:MAG: leucine-rich repeat protein, partial [Hominilimicola sp.]
MQKKFTRLIAAALTVSITAALLPQAVFAAPKEDTGHGDAQIINAQYPFEVTPEWAEETPVFENESAFEMFNRDIFLLNTDDPTLMQDSTTQPLPTPGTTITDEGKTITEEKTVEIVIDYTNYGTLTLNITRQIDNNDNCVSMDVIVAEATKSDAASNLTATPATAETRDDPSSVTVDIDVDVDGATHKTMTFKVGETENGGVGVMPTALQSGTHGDNFTWELSTDGKLTINGAGDMPRVSLKVVPWATYRSSITSITLPDGLTNIGRAAFFGCENLTSITIPNGVTDIADYAFSSCYRITSVTLPESVTSISKYAFTHCNGLTSVTIPNGVISIGEYAFNYCNSLESVTIPDSVTSIGQGAFNRCYGLTSVTIPDRITSISQGAFNGCSGLTSVTIPDSVTSIGNSAFFACTGLIDITLPDGLTDIGKSAFRRCSNLTNIMLPDGLQNIGDYAFSYCTGLTEITVPETVTSIGVDAFYGHSENCILYVYSGSYAEQYAAENKIKYEDIFMDKKVTLTVRDAQGKIGSDGYTVRWYEKGGDAILATGEVFLGYDAKKEFEYEVIPLNDYIYSYYPSQRQALTPNREGGEYYADYTLLPINEVKASGMVTDKKGNPISGAAVEFTQNYSSQAVKTVSAVTDENGRYTVDLMDVPTTAVCSGDAYYTATTEVIKSCANASECQFAPIVLEDMPKNKITLSVNIQESAKAGEKAVLVPITNFNDITFELYNETTQSAVDFRTQYPCIYPAEGKISEGDAIRVKAVNASGSEVETTAIIGSDISADAALNFVLGGTFCAKVDKSAFALVFDANGGFVKKYSDETEIKSESLPDGKYTVIFIANSGYMPQLSTLSKLDEMGVGESEYIKKIVNINKGVISDLGSISIPDFDVSKLYYTVEDETYCMVNKNTASTGEFISLRIGYEIEEKYASSDEKVVVELPDGIKPIQGSMAVNGVKSSYTVTNGGIEIPVNTSSAVIRLYVMADTAGSFDIRAYLKSQINGSLITQPVGSASVNISNVSFTLPSKIGRTNFVVSGKAMAKSAVTVYFDGKAAAETTSNSAGTWSVRYEPENLGTHSEHDVYVVIKNRYGIQYQSDVKTLEYEKDCCEVERVTMINTAHAPGTTAVLVENKTVFEFLTADTNKHTYDYWPKYPEFTFVVEITGDAETVQVVTKNSYGDCTYIDCEYDEVSGNWIGTHDFTSFSYVPCTVSAVIEQKETNGMYDFTGISGSTEIAGMNNSYTPSEKKYTEPDASMAYSVDSVYPKKGSNGKVTLNIKGELLEPNMSAILTNGSISYTAEKIYWKNHESVYATFDLTNAPDGKFTLNVNGRNEQASLEDCFTVDSSLEKGKLVYSINMNKRVKSGNEYQGSITAVNTGYTDVYAPVFELNGDN